MPIKLKRSSVAAKVPTTDQVELGELALNTYDGKLYTKKDNGTASIVEIGAVTSVAGKSGAVTLVKGDVGLSNVDNTSDANKPVSTATQTALNAKANASHTHAAAEISNSTAAGRALLTAADAAAQRTALALGTAATSNTGTAAGNVVALDAGGKLPAVDGSALTNLPSGGDLKLLSSGTVALAAALDIILPSGYRGYLLLFAGFVPVTDAATLGLRFSTNGGTSFDATGYGTISYRASDNNSFSGTDRYPNDGIIYLTKGGGVGNAASEGVSGHVEILNPASASLFTRASFRTSYMTSDSPAQNAFSVGSGARKTAQDTDALRLLFDNGNIASCSWAIYG